MKRTALLRSKLKAKKPMRRGPMISRTESVVGMSEKRKALWRATAAAMNGPLPSKLKRCLTKGRRTVGVRQAGLEKGKQLQRSRLSKRGARSRREEKALKAFRAGVLERCRIYGLGRTDVYRCERCSICVPAVAFEAHHRLPRSRGGAHSMENSAGLCSGPLATNDCHAAVHDRRVDDWASWIVSRKPSGVTKKPGGAQ